jgi:hypothetical protein
VQFHISRLKDRSIEVQLNTIQELQLLEAEAEAAMPALQELFETSSNIDVKRAAQKAGLVIYNAVKAKRQSDE